MSILWQKILALICLLAGIALLALGLPELWHAIESPRWPTASGHVVAARIDEGPGSDSGSSFRAVIVYEYPVAQVTHSANRVAFGDHGAPDRDQAGETVARYRVGKTVTVHYRAADPANAVLEPGLRWRVGLVPALGFAFCAAGLVVLRGARGETA